MSATAIKRNGNGAVVLQVSPPKLKRVQETIKERNDLVLGNPKQEAGEKERPAREMEVMEKTVAQGMREVLLVRFGVNLVMTEVQEILREEMTEDLETMIEVLLVR